jgi:hypothetical protein
MKLKWVLVLFLAAFLVYFVAGLLKYSDVRASRGIPSNQASAVKSLRDICDAELEPVS